MTTQTEPQIIERAPQPYVCVRALVTMSSIPEIADRLPELVGLVAGSGLEPSAPFLKYDVIHRSGQLDLEAGLAVPPGVTLDSLSGSVEGLRLGVLPGGRFASATHVGPPSSLMDATADLLDWGSDQGLTWDVSTTDRAESWGLRLELYKTDPRVEPDLDAWETELLFRLKD